MRENNISHVKNINNQNANVNLNEKQRNDWNKNNNNIINHNVDEKFAFNNVTPNYNNNKNNYNPNSIIEIKGEINTNQIQNEIPNPNFNEPPESIAPSSIDTLDESVGQTLVIKLFKFFLLK